MMELILANLEIISIGLLFLFGAWTSRSLASIALNVHVLKIEKFKKEKLICGFCKIISGIVATGILIVLITTLPVFLNQYVGFIEIPPETLKLFDIFALLGAIISPTLEYCKEAYLKVKELFNIKFNIEDYFIKAQKKSK